jgi:NADPH:quinone reductase-like Zn-dependent oxidoreductase
MRALLRREYGDSRALELAEIETPTPGAGQVLVRVTAAGIDAGTLHLMAGQPALIRLATGFGRPRDPRIGTELAGVVEAVGPGVSSLAVGDAVFGVTRGSFADAVLASADKLAKLPLGLDPVEAAAAAVSGMTAFEALAAAGPLAGTRVLVTGAGGGVGSFAVQLAIAAGASVTGVCSTAKLPLVRSLGAEAVDYTEGEPTGRFDVLIDTGGLRSLRALRDLLVPGGRALLVGGEGGSGPLGGFERQLFAPLTMAFSGRRFVAITSSTTRAKLEQLAARLLADGVHAAIDRRYPLAEGIAALRHLESGSVVGKLVILP